jgi:hypothetical protein
MLLVSAAEKATSNQIPCLTCSPETAQFLGYWLNYNKYYTPISGGSRFSLTNPAGKVYQPRNNKTGNKTGDPAKYLNGYGQFVDPVLPGPSLKSIEKIWDDHSEMDKWTYWELWEELNAASEGSIYICASGGHAWLLMKFGPNFRVPQKYIFGGLNNDPCEDGIYMIQANGPGPYSPLSVLYNEYTDKDLVNNKGDEYLDKGAVPAPHFTCRGDTINFEDIGNTLKDAADKIGTTISSTKIEKIKIFNASDLVIKNGQLKKEKSSTKLPHWAWVNINADLDKIASRMGIKDRSRKNKEEILKNLIRKKTDNGKKIAKFKKNRKFKYEESAGIEVYKQFKKYKDEETDAIIIYYDKTGYSKVVDYPEKKPSSRTKFWVFKLKSNILDPNTGLINEDLDYIPKQLLLYKKQIDVDLTSHDCRPLLAVD